MTPRKVGLVRIAIGGRYLDEVQIRLDLPDSLSHLSFPANRHRGRVEEDRVTVFTQGPTAVKLFADGVLPPVGGGANVCAVGRTKSGVGFGGVPADGTSPRMLSGGGGALGGPSPRAVSILGARVDRYDKAKLARKVSAVIATVLNSSRALPWTCNTSRSVPTIEA